MRGPTKKKAKKMRKGGEGKGKTKKRMAYY